MARTKYTETQFWRKPKGEAHEAIVAHLGSIQPNRQNFEMRYRQALAFYRNMAEAQGHTTPIPSSLYGYLERKPRRNVIQSIIDTTYARVTSRKPRPKFLLNNATRWTAREHAKLLDKYVEGIFHQTELYEETAAACFDALVSGFGAIKMYWDDDRFHAERINPVEVVVDDRRTAKPRTMYHVKRVPVEVLEAYYPKHKKQIQKAASESGYLDNNMRIQVEEVDCFEAWHLPPRKGEKGRHVICVEGATLLDEPWEFDWFPIEVIHLNPEPDGFYKQSWVERLQPLQMELNRLSERIHDAVKLMGTAWVTYREGDVRPEDLQNLPGTLVGVTPQAGLSLNDSIGVVVPPSLSGQVFQQLESIQKSMFDLSPVGEPEATSRVPASLESGRAIKMYHEVGSLRLSRIVQQWENFHVRIAYRLVEMSKKLHSSGIKVKSEYETDNFVEVIPWSDVKVDCSFSIKVYPTNFLSETPSSKIQDIEHLMRIGVINDPESVAKHFDYPDVGEATERKYGPQRNVERAVNEMLETGKYVPPSPFLNFEQAIYVAGQLANLAESLGAPPERLELVERYISELADLAIPPEPPPGPMGPGAEMMVPAGPGGASPMGELNIAPTNAGTLMGG